MSVITLKASTERQREPQRAQHAQTASSPHPIVAPLTFRRSRSCKTLSIPSLRTSLAAGLGPAGAAVEVCDTLLSHRDASESHGLGTSERRLAMESEASRRSPSAATSMPAAARDKASPGDAAVRNTTSTKVWGCDVVTPLSLPANPRSSLQYAKVANAFLSLSRIPACIEASKRVLLVLWLFHGLRYCDEDIVSILAHASAYSASIQQRNDASSDPTELGCFLVVCVYAAHGWVMDLHCPARVWFESVLEKRCSMKAFNNAIMHLMRLRGYRMRVSDRSIAERCNSLKSSCA